MKKMLLLLVCILASYSAMANATLTQKEWRWRNDDGTETSATWKAGQEEAISINRCTGSGENLRLRMSLLVNPDPANASNNASRTVDRYLEYATSPSGPWTQINGLPNAFIQAVSTEVSNNTPTTQQLSATDGVPGSGLILDGSIPNQVTFSTPAGVVTRREYEWVIVSNAQIAAGTYYFRYGGANTYPNTLPSITFYGGPSASEQDIVACDVSSYESPSGDYTWTAPGSYDDIIPNMYGCDSVITTNLTFANRTYNAFNATACTNYISPSGAYTWRASGIYNDTIPNARGCDSVLTVDLAITRIHNFIEEEACESFESPSGAYTWTTSGLYNDTIQNEFGCDIVLTIDLTINHHTSRSMIEEACESFESPSGEYTWTTSGVYNDTIPNAHGCDSVLTIDLTIHYNTAHSVTELACESFESPSGEYTWTTSGTYNDTISNAHGCDSILTINLTIGHPASGTDTQTACGSYTWINGTTYETSNTTATHILQTPAGCDSVVTLNLTINNVDTEITLSGLTIAATAGADSYQWLNCDTETAIQGATGASYTATENGSYAVMIGDGDCSAVSACTEITTVGLKNLNKDLSFSIVPNPTNGLFHLQFAGESVVAISVLDVQGKVVLTGAEIVSGQEIDLSAVENGVYVLQISSGKGMAVQRIVKH